MIKENEIFWLNTTHPGLSLNEDRSEAEGILGFTATYNPAIDQFLILFPGVPNNIGGIELSGEFNVKIKAPARESQQLPLVYLDKHQVELSTDRHINWNGTACLCGPIEEVQYAKDRIAFPEFLNFLVIPFLYGQLYYNEFSKWPWDEYSHGALGILESYLNAKNPNFATNCINRLKTDQRWDTIKALLSQKEEIEGHTPCICNSHDHIRRCHPKTWKGLCLLRKDITNSGLSLD